MIVLVSPYLQVCSPSNLHIMFHLILSDMYACSCVCLLVIDVSLLDPQLGRHPRRAQDGAHTRGGDDVVI
jgi:hypothetical protein